MARRDILARYRGSFGDVLWTILNPLLLMGTYFFVFGVVLQARFGAGSTVPPASRSTSWPGMLPWLAFSEPAGRAPAGGAGASQLREEADLPAGNAAGESGGGRASSPSCSRWACSWSCC